MDILDAIGDDADKLTRLLCAHMLALPIGGDTALVFEVSEQHNKAGSCTDGVHDTIMTANFYPVILTRRVS